MPPAADIHDSLVYRVRAKMGGYHPVLRWYRQHRPTWFWLRAHAVGRVTARYTREQGLTVKRGPFEGLTYPPGAVGHVGQLPGKLLGAYESGVVATLAELGAEHDLFVDIGSAEGYYCVGMARAHPKLHVIGYETTVGERELASEMAKLNGVTIDQRGTAGHESLQALPEGSILLLVDIEGYEAVLLNPDLVPRLRQMSMVVELHDAQAPGIDGLLRERFSSSHDIRLVRDGDVNLGPFPELKDWSPTESALATMERPAGRADVWMVLRPK